MILNCFYKLRGVIVPIQMTNSYSGTLDSIPFWDAEKRKIERDSARSSNASYRFLHHFVSSYIAYLLRLSRIYHMQISTEKKQHFDLSRLWRKPFRAKNCTTWSSIIFITSSKTFHECYEEIYIQGTSKYASHMR